MLPPCFSTFSCDVLFADAQKKRGPDIGMENFTNCESACLADALWSRKMTRQKFLFAKTEGESLIV